VSNAYLSQLDLARSAAVAGLLHKLRSSTSCPTRPSWSAPAIHANRGGTETAPSVIDSRLGPITTDEEHALREYLEFLRSAEAGRSDGDLVFSNSRPSTVSASCSTTTSSETVSQGREPDEIYLLSKLQTISAWRGSIVDKAI